MLEVLLTSVFKSTAVLVDKFCLDTAPNLKKALNLNLILIELTEFWSYLSTCNSLLDGLHHITCANLTPLITSGCLQESTMAKPVITIANSLGNIRIAYVPLLTVIGNAVGIFLSQPYHADKLVSEHSPSP